MAQLYNWASTVCLARLPRVSLFQKTTRKQGWGSEQTEKLKQIGKPSIEFKQKHLTSTVEHYDRDDSVVLQLQLLQLIHETVQNWFAYKLCAE